MKSEGDPFVRYKLTKLINASGTMTPLGSSRVDSVVIDAMASMLPHFVMIEELQARASSVIARLTGAEAGCVTASAAAGIALAVAATMTGTDFAKIEALPDPEDPRTEVLLQLGHAVNFGSSVTQLVRLIGARARYLGSVNECKPHQLRSQITARTTAALFVVSHHANQTGLLPLEQFAAICHEQGIPVIVDGASEYDLTGFLQRGADVAVYSGHKFLGGPTSGIVAGALPIVRATYANQERGIGRCMKVGKESIAGVMAALERWESLPHAEVRRLEERRTERAIRALSACPALRAAGSPDPTGNPITRTRVHLDEQAAGVSISRLVELLRAGTPSIRVRDHHLDLGFFELDPCNVTDEEMELVCTRIVQIVQKPARDRTAEPAKPYDRLDLLSRWPQI